MKVQPTKADIRKRLQQQTEDFLRGGGEVKPIPRGISGRENPGGVLRQNQFIPNEKAQVNPEDQVPLNDVISTIEARRKVKPKKSEARPAKKKPRKKIIYDDFGEAIRWEWVED